MRQHSLMTKHTDQLCQVGKQVGIQILYVACITVKTHRRIGLQYWWRWSCPLYAEILDDVCPDRGKVLVHERPLGRHGV